MSITHTLKCFKILEKKQTDHNNVGGSRHQYQGATLQWMDPDHV